jgi:hypothetical protein
LLAQAAWRYVGKNFQRHQGKRTGHVLILAAGEFLKQSVLHKTIVYGGHFVDSAIKV